MVRKFFNWLALLALLVLAVAACSGTLPEPEGAGTGEGTDPLNISALEFNPESGAGVEVIQPVPQAGSLAVELVSQPPEIPEEPAAAPETPAETQPASKPNSIADYLTVDLVSIATLPAGTGASGSSAVTAVAFSPDGALLAVALADGTAQLWDLADQSLLQTLARHGTPISDLAFSPDGSLLATAGEDSRVLLWETSSGTLSDAISTSLIGRALAVAFSPTGDQIAVGGHKCAVAQYSVWTGLLNRTFPQPGCDLRGSGSVQSWGLAYAAEGSLLITADGQLEEGGSIQIWDAGAYTGAEQVAWFPLGIRTFDVSPDGTLLAAALIGSSQITLVNAADGSVIYTLSGHQHRVNSVTFSPDGRLLVSGSRDGTVRIWDVTRGFLLRILEGHTDAVTAVAYSPDGALIASGSEDGTVRLWAFAPGGN